KGFEGGAEAVLRSERGEGERRGKELHVGSGHEVAVGVLFEQNGSRFCIGDQQAPVAFGGLAGTGNGLCAGGEEFGGLQGMTVSNWCFVVGRFGCGRNGRMTGGAPRRLREGARRKQKYEAQATCGVSAHAHPV